MSYLLDTNVLSETWKKRPKASVVDWIRSTPTEKLFLSVITIGEIRRGIQMLKAGKKQDQLLRWLDEQLPAYFGANILPIDIAVADRWGFMTAHAKRTLPAIDGLLAATALVHNLKMVTRNEKDFDVAGLEVINPF